MFVRGVELNNAHVGVAEALSERISVATPACDIQDLQGKGWWVKASRRKQSTLGS